MLLFQTKASTKPGLVEQANGTTENRLAAIVEQFKEKNWSK